MANEDTRALHLNRPMLGFPGGSDGKGSAHKQRPRGVSAPKCCAFIKRVIFKEVSGHQDLIKSDVLNFDSIHLFLNYQMR